MSAADEPPSLAPDESPPPEEVAAPDESTTSGELLRRLAAHAPRETRYAVEGEVARGGMGTILAVRDEDLRRTLAMKVILGDGDAADERALARFLEEAQVTAQLDHPGVVPVHELGLDAEGRVYFTMKLVRGRDLKQVFELAWEEQEGWSETRALSVILKACEAVAYAHKKGVIHRDLKPANVMVGNFGEVYVMDWGLARVVGRRDKHDIRIRTEVGASFRSVRTQRREEREDAPDSPLVTMDGDVMGTPCYMPPEQARGEIETLSPRSDVYSVGAMLYHLLARQMPYVAPRARVSNRTVLAMLLQGAPKRVHEVRQVVPAELVSIQEKAMAREPSDRYADTLELAEDLRAYLENRVVRAHETGAVAELRKWVARNQGLAAASAAAVVFLAVGLVVSSRLYVKAAEKERQATASLNDVLSLSAIQDLQDLVAGADALWPADPGRIAACEEWLSRARALLDGAEGKPGLAGHRAKLEELRAHAQPGPEERWWRAQLERLVAGLEALADPAGGLVAPDAVSPARGWSVGKRLAFARAVEGLTRSGDEAKRRWSAAIASIADPAQCPLYGGLRIVPQLGLLPIGRDGRSGLWEFAHPPSGDAPERGADGGLLVSGSTGVVLVLIPGGAFRMGAQAADPTEANHDPDSTGDESPVRDVGIAPFFLSKHEMTQGQWERIAGSNPSDLQPGREVAGKQVDLRHPVEKVVRADCEEILRRLDLALPTEAQWEYATRAGTASVWWTGDDPRTIEGAGNVADLFCRENGGSPSWTFEEWLDDGYAGHAPVGSYRPNAFGLHDVIGNVWEWVADPYPAYTVEPRVGDGLRPGTGATGVIRGGGYDGAAARARPTAGRCRSRTAWARSA